MHLSLLISNCISVEYVNILSSYLDIKNSETPDNKDKIIEKLTHEVAVLTNRNVQLEAELNLYKQRLAKFEIPKNSSNSSIPPSKDENRPARKSLREKSGLKSGGQNGHQGSTLQMTENPDKIEEMVSDYCKKCGKDLCDVKPNFVYKRQVVDLPEIKPIYTEYQCFSKKCSCGHDQVPEFPDHASNYIQYGASVEAAVGYCSVYQYLPYKRMSELFLHFYNLPISEGTIGNMLERLGQRIQPIYNSLQGAVAKSKTAVGGDETGVRVNGKKYWAWIWQTAMYTFIAVSESRGKKVIEEFFPCGFQNAVLVSDRWKAHISTYAKGHQLCIAHLLRDLNYLIELETTAWAKSIKTLFKQALELKRKIPEYSIDDPRVIIIETKLNQLLNENLDKNETPKTLTFKKSLIAHRNYIFTFLYHEDVPPDNNASERGFRNYKVKLKISGQFKTGHNTFAKIRSFVETCKKNKIPILQALKLVAQIPILPAE